MGVKSCGKAHPWCGICRPDVLIILSLAHYRPGKPLTSVEVNKRLRVRRRGAVRWYKLLHPCADCENGDPRVLDFDHVRGKKLFNINEGMTYSFGTILAEIEKCDVVCANCHRIREAERISRA